MIRRFGIPVLVVSALACAPETEPLPSAAPTPPGTFTIEPESLATVMPIEGSVAARRRADIATRMMARVSGVTVDVGDEVRAGQTLVVLGAEDVANNRTRAIAGRDAGRAARDEAARMAARMDTLLAQDAIARVQRDAAHVGLAQAEAQLANAEASLRDVETSAGYATLAAPFDGTVASRSVDPGDLATPGVPLLVVEDREAREGILALPADRPSDLSRGTLVVVIGPDGRAVVAPVRALARAADPATRTMQIKIGLPAGWPTGVSFTALIPAGRHLGVAIPSSHVIRRGQLTGVRVLQGDQTVLRWVRLGRALEQPGDSAAPPRIEVLSGLEPGDRVVP